ncbi:MAG: AAA family ATPase [Hyphomonas sp.]|jgi:ATP-dependent DNA helicase RecQ|nr:AAA family ATPase [Hyphomonas sp.]
MALRRTNQLLLDANEASLPQDVVRLLRTLESDGRKMGRPAGLLELRQVNRDQANIRLLGTWTEVRELSTLRLAAARALVDMLLTKAKTGADTQKIALVDFSETEVLEAFKNDMTLDLASVRDVPSFIQYLLVYLHEHGVIELKNGKALIAQAMNLRVLEPKKGKQRRQFTKGDYASLLVHYSEKVFQIHVMGEYARMGVERLGAHLRLISAYFQMGKAAFAARFLREKPEVYERATGLDSFKKIVDDLRNPTQQAIVAEPASANMLILAGPGSGKTRVIAHRCAYLHLLLPGTRLPRNERARSMPLPEWVRPPRRRRECRLMSLRRDLSGLQAGQRWRNRV